MNALRHVCRRAGAPALALLPLLLGGCEYPASSTVAPNPVAYVRPAPTAPFSDGGRMSGNALSPYVAVTIPPPAPVAPGTPLGERTLGAPAPGEEPSGPSLGFFLKPKPAPVVTVPAYTAPVYGPAGARQGA